MDRRSIRGDNWPKHVTVAGLLVRKDEGAVGDETIDVVGASSEAALQLNEHPFVQDSPVAGLRQPRVLSIVYQSPVYGGRLSNRSELVAHRLLAPSTENECGGNVGRYNAACTILSQTALCGASSAA